MVAFEGARIVADQIAEGAVGALDAAEFVEDHEAEGGGAERGVQDRKLVRGAAIFDGSGPRIRQWIGLHVNSLG